MRELNGKMLHFDVDGVIAKTKGNDYVNSIPFDFAIKHVNRAYDMGFQIVLSTARYSARCKGQTAEIWNRGFIELKTWCDNAGLKYDLLILGQKPAASLFMDDRAVRIESLKGEQDWIDNFWPAVEKLAEVNEYNQPIQTELEKQADLVKDIH